MTDLLKERIRAVYDLQIIYNNCFANGSNDKILPSFHNRWFDAVDNLLMSYNTCAGIDWTKVKADLKDFILGLNSAVLTEVKIGPVDCINKIYDSLVDYAEERTGHTSTAWLDCGKYYCTR